jgi:hypothetical protein
MNSAYFILRKICSDDTCMVIVLSFWWYWYWLDGRHGVKIVADNPWSADEYRLMILMTTVMVMWNNPRPLSLERPIVSFDAKNHSSCKFIKYPMNERFTSNLKSVNTGF